MKPFLFLLLIAASFTSHTASAQDYLSDDREQIKEEFHNMDTSKYKITVADSADRLKVSITGYETIQMEYLFDPLDNLCNGIIISYSCGKCADKHIEDFLAKKSSKWKKLDTDTYISRKRMSTFKSATGTTVGSPEMIIKRAPGQQICTTVYFSVPMMDKDKWKELTKK